MAIRGGKGGDPVSFGKGGSEGSGASKNPYENHDYAGEWAGKKLTDRMRPQPGGSTDYEGNEKYALGSPERAQYEHNLKRQAAFDKAKSAQDAAKFAAGYVPPSESNERAKPATNQTRGVNVVQTMGTNKFYNNVDRISRLLGDRARELGVSLTPKSQRAIKAIGIPARPSNDGADVNYEVGVKPVSWRRVDNAKGVGHTEQEKKIDQATESESGFRTGEIKPLTQDAGAQDVLVSSGEKSVQKANERLAAARQHLIEGRKYQNATDGKEQSNAVAHHHYIQAFNHLKAAHKELHSPLIDALTSGRAMTSKSVSSNEIKDLEGHARTLPVVKPNLPFKTVAIGKKEKVNVGSTRFEELKEDAETMADLPASKGGSTKPLEKLNLGERGTSRGGGKVKRREAAKRKQNAIDMGFKGATQDAPVKDARKVSDSQNRPKSGNPLAAVKPETPGENLPEITKPVFRPSTNKTSDKPIGPKRPPKKNSGK